MCHVKHINCAETLDNVMVPRTNVLQQVVLWQERFWQVEKSPYIVTDIEAPT